MPRKANQYSVGMIGCGRRAQQFAQAVVADPRCRITALADPNSDAAKALGDAHAPDAKAYTDFNEMLQAEKPDVVVGAVWTGLHLPVVRACAAAGVKVLFSEKPMAANWGESKEMAEAAKAAGMMLVFCHQRRYAPGNQQVRAWIEQGLFGEIKRMDLYSPCDLLDCGTHTIDQAMSFNSESPAKWVMGAIDLSEIKMQFGVPAEALGIGLIVFENGVRAWIQSKGPDRDMPTGVRIEGTKGLIEVAWDGQIGQAVRFDDPSWKPEAEADADADHGGHMNAVISETLNHWENETESPISAAHALRVSETIFAIYESARRRAAVTLPLDEDAHALVRMTEDLKKA